MNYLQKSHNYLGLITISVIVFYANSAIAQIDPDGTLPNNSQKRTETNTITIEGGTLSPDGKNLFHSFREFSVPQNYTVEFKHSGNVQNIISRITGNSGSHIDGILKVNGTTNLFIINPNGITFGANASLNIGGSFIATTASSLNFGDGSKFSAVSPTTTPLLTVSVPIGLQFGAVAKPIRNQSQARSSDGTTNGFGGNVGIQVKPSKTLALVGGDITFEGGNLTAPSGRIELGSVAGNSLVNLEINDKQGLILGYENVQKFQDIKLTQRTEIPSYAEVRSYVDSSGERGGTIQVQAKRLLLDKGSIISTNTSNSELGGILTVNTSESVELNDRNTSLRARNRSIGEAGNLTITTGKLIVRDGAQVVINSTDSIDSVPVGELTVNASDSVELLGFSSPGNGRIISSELSSIAPLAGNAGNITITTNKLRIQGPAKVTTQSAGTLLASGEAIPATGKGGNLTVKAFESVELIGDPSTGRFFNLLSTSTQGVGDAGNLTITTGKLTVRDGARISSSSEGNIPNPGGAGDLSVTARSIFLENQGVIETNSQAGQGGNIKLKVRDLLLMRRNSQISANAGSDGNGGNITIKAPNGFILAPPLGNNDITANANSGSGGKITIDAKRIFGFVPRTRADLVRELNTEDPEQLDPSNLLTNDITAFSGNPSLNGIIQINSLDVDPSKGLVELPVNVVDNSTQVAAGCNGGGKLAKGKFTVSGRGGIPSNPIEPLTAETVLADWITLEPDIDNRANALQNRTVNQEQLQPKNYSQTNEIVEAQGWIVDANGNVVLVAQVPTATLHNSALTSVSCAAN
ncbi:filamentous hemagglutinin N-terminal domain-containing protein [Halotia branconii]|uniref:Filamentous hemagglutinin N-terminal domain-containing protein n=1 Tax=Halotia branconii CENA392 TaxID=1539056 RepID=A0AAJ6NSV2_9CYAN|nr:filamentous hemagglutinin N-terminal domain-containing protein [Halotia branconii]WGV26095.1 filamentous hemagglutinin N-terminal domain-containing protein [Halotia branconii CENA392]